MQESSQVSLSILRFYLFYFFSPLQQLNSITESLVEEQKKNKLLNQKLLMLQKQQENTSETFQLRNQVSELKKEKAHLEEVLKNFLLERELEKLREFSEDNSGLDQTTEDVPQESGSEERVQEKPKNFDIVIREEQSPPEETTEQPSEQPDRTLQKIDNFEINLN